MILKRNERLLPLFLMGDAIDLELSLGTLTLLATSYDYFDGCSQWFYLLNENDQLIDSVKMPDQFGFIENVEKLSEDVISFAYFGTNKRWHLNVHEKAYRPFTLKSVGTRPFRSFLKPRYLEITQSENR